MNNLFRISKTSRQWPLLIALIFPILVIGLGMFITNHNNGKLYLSLITAAGGLGGILSATRFPSIKIPHIERPNKYVIGFLTDVIAGIAGAYIVFLILPNHLIMPPVNNGDPYLETKELLVNIRLIAISIVGGYLGRALLEKVGEDLVSQVKTIEAKVDEVDQRIRDRFSIESFLAEILYIPKAIEDFSVTDRFIDLLKLAEPQTRKYIFYRTQSLRFEYSLELDHIYKKSKEAPADNVLENRRTYLILIRERMDAFKEIYRCLFESFTGSFEDTTEPLSLYYREFAYSMKDSLVAQIFGKTNPDIASLTWSKSWLRIQDHLEKSRTFIARNHEDKSIYSEFYMNDAICLIMLDGNFMLGKQSPPDAMNKINEQLHNAAKSRAHDDESINFYPIREWRQLNPKQGLV